MLTTWPVAAAVSVQVEFGLIVQVRHAVQGADVCSSWLEQHELAGINQGDQALTHGFPVQGQIVGDVNDGGGAAALYHGQDIGCAVGVGGITGGGYASRRARSIVSLAIHKATSARTESRHFTC